VDGALLDCFGRRSGKRRYRLSRRQYRDQSAGVSGGMTLSIPIIVIVKVVSQHVEQLHPMAELLGD